MEERIDKFNWKKTIKNERRYTSEGLFNDDRDDEKVILPTY